MGKVLLKTNQVEEAYYHLDLARSEAMNLGSRWRLWKILAILAEAEILRGNSDTAITLRTEASDNVQFIADHTPTEEIRASFLATPAVRQLLNNGEKPAALGTA